MPRSTINGRLFVCYMYLNPNRLPQRVEAYSPWRSVGEVNPQVHAKAAPTEAEWFRYYVQRPGAQGYTPLDGVPTYYLDTTPEESSSTQAYGLMAVRLRRSDVHMPFNPKNPRQHAVISSR